MTMNKIVAFIPARSGSKRLPDKNIKSLDGHPLLAYSISSAIDSGLFDSVICATDDEKYAEIARHYGAEVPILRPAGISGDKSPDIEWVDWMLTELEKRGRFFNVFSILRPTSPFRKAQTIRRAWDQFLKLDHVDSLRAVEKCKQHPGKMWVLREKMMLPLMPLQNEQQPWHCSQYAALPEFYIQNASLEIAWTRIVTNSKSIAGDIVAPFFTNKEEGLDVNDEFDWWRAEYLLQQGLAKLPAIKTKAYRASRD